MRWYFAIDEAGTATETGTLAKLAVLSARAIGELEPVLLYYGQRNEFTGWMEAHAVRVVDAGVSFLAEIKAAEAAGIYRPHSIGHWLRLAIPSIEQERAFALYTDCDVIFLKAGHWDRLRPRVFMAGPEFDPAERRYFNAGILLMNVPAMRESYPAFEAHIKTRIASGAMFTYDDQIALNEAYEGFWERLPPEANWKPYWPLNHAASVLHFHGPKPSVLDAMIEGRWEESNPTALFWGRIARTRAAHYAAWCAHLGDVLQMVAPSEAIAFARRAGAVAGMMKRGVAFEPLDIFGC